MKLQPFLTATLILAAGAWLASEVNAATLFSRGANVELL